MKLSHILVTTSQPYYDHTIDALSAIKGLNLIYCDKEGSQIIVTQEAESNYLEKEGLQRIKSVPHVLMAKMVSHYQLHDAA